MRQEAMTYFTDIWLTLLGLIVFFSYFVFMVYRVYKLNPNYISKMSNLPNDTSSSVNPLEQETKYDGQ